MKYIIYIYIYKYMIQYVQVEHKFLTILEMKILIDIKLKIQRG